MQQMFSLCLHVVVRSYLGYYAASHPHSAAKRQWARVVVGWVTSREVLVTYPFCFFCDERRQATSVLRKTPRLPREDDPSYQTVFSSTFFHSRVSAELLGEADRGRLSTVRRAARGSIVALLRYRCAWSEGHCRSWRSDRGLDHPINQRKVRSPKGARCRVP